VVVLAGRQPDPAEPLLGWQLGADRPLADVVGCLGVAAPLEIEHVGAVLEEGLSLALGDSRFDGSKTTGRFSDA